MVCGASRAITCSVCGFSLPFSQWGCFYVTDGKGERILLDRGLESTTIAETLGIDEESITGCSFAPAGRKAPIDLMEERVGYLSSCLCCSCLARIDLDLREDEPVCPLCLSREVLTLAGLAGTACPRCREGVMEEKPVTAGPDSS